MTKHNRGVFATLSEDNYLGLFELIERRGLRGAPSAKSIVVNEAVALLLRRDRVVVKVTQPAPVDESDTDDDDDFDFAD
jgi:hypothetical protein